MDLFIYLFIHLVRQLPSFLSVGYAMETQMAASGYKVGAKWHC
jgi:hypothetical protein